MPPIQMQIEDENGAGDTFAGAFAYAIARNFGLEKGIAFATIAASMNATKYTSRLSIPTLTEVSNYYDSKFGKENNPNNQPQEQQGTSQPAPATSINGVSQPAADAQTQTPQEGQNGNA